jgi:hypothetical protein
MLSFTLGGVCSGLQKLGGYLFHIFVEREEDSTRLERAGQFHKNGATVDFLFPNWM